MPASYKSVDVTAEAVEVHNHDGSTETYRRSRIKPDALADFSKEFVLELSRLRVRAGEVQDAEAFEDLRARLCAIEGMRVFAAKTRIEALEGNRSAVDRRLKDLEAKAKAGTTVDTEEAWELQAQIDRLSQRVDQILSAEVTS